MSPDDFLNSVGRKIENQISQIQTKTVAVDTLEANYDEDRFSYKVEFKWQTDPIEAVKELQSVLNSYTGQLNQEQRDGQYVWHNSENSGFFAASAGASFVKMPSASYSLNSLMISMAGNSAPASL